MENGHQTSLTDLTFPPQASMKQSGSTQTESDVSLKIPEYTVVAFSLIELKVKRNGKFGEEVYGLSMSQV